MVTICYIFLLITIFCLHGMEKNEKGILKNSIPHGYSPVIIASLPSGSQVADACFFAYNPNKYMVMTDRGIAIIFDITSQKDQRPFINVTKEIVNTRGCLLRKAFYQRGNLHTVTNSYLEKTSNLPEERKEDFNRHSCSLQKVSLYKKSSNIFKHEKSFYLEDLDVIAYDGVSFR